ncbi:MAG TPA: phenylacetate--CoA ligase family protein [Gammaproteobacteria bacterium]|nr:phenylacetate--CoA ligase family protein [Gammaproteobacteria bacterium]
MAQPSNADLLHDFYTTRLEERLARHRRQAPGAAAIALCREAAEHVPAYRAFLQAHQIDPGAVGDHTALASLPLMTKDNYMRAHPLPARCRGGRIEDSEIVAFSSGSTGRPMLWPRGLGHELDIAWRFEQIFRDAFGADRRSTLAVVCFPMGTWVGGVYTAACCRYLAQKGYPLTLATPGNNKDEIFRVVEELGPHFDQVALLGYPPFVKDALDTGAARGIEWPRYRPKLVFAGEVFTEEWRDLVCRRIGSEAPWHDTASLYGTADAGVLGNETPLSIAVRRFLARHPGAARALFGESRLPTLVQYDPLSRYFEVSEDTLAVTADNGVPLIRYHIADRGGIVDYAGMLDFVRRHGAELTAELAPRDPHERYALPFVYLFGRADFTLSYYGANIYPENVSVALEQPSVTQWVSGKFVMEVRPAGDGDARLAVAVELLPGVSAEERIGQALSASILQQLRRLNSEFAHYVPEDRQAPMVSLHPFGDPDYFPPGVKHRYTRRPTA